MATVRIWLHAMPDFGISGINKQPSSPFISNEHPHRLAFSHLFTAYLILPLANPNIKHEKIILTK